MRSNPQEVADRSDGFKYKNKRRPEMASFFYSFPPNTARFNVGAIPVKKEAPADAGFKSIRF